MAGEEKEYRSRLRGTGGPPTRGMGSAYPQNQAVVGAADPVEAARLAKLSPEEAQDEQERRERLQGDLDAMREDILIAVLDGQWSPDTTSWPQVPDGQEQWKTLIENQPAGEVQAWHKTMNKALDEAVNSQDEETLRDQFSNVGVIDPDDPLYDPMTDKARKKLIEKDLKPLDFEEMVWKGHCTQLIETRPGFRVLFRTLSTQHGLWIEYFMSQQSETSYQHTRHLFSLAQVAATLDEVNGKQVGSDMSKYVKQEQREEFLKALEERMEFLGKLPGVISDDLIVQYVWFTGRVRRLLTGDLMRKVGNS